MVESPVEDRTSDDSPPLARIRATTDGTLWSRSSVLGSWTSRPHKSCGPVYGSINTHRRRDRAVDTTLSHCRSVIVVHAVGKHTWNKRALYVFPGSPSDTQSCRRQSSRVSLDRALTSIRWLNGPHECAVGWGVSVVRKRRDVLLRRGTATRIEHRTRRRDTNHATGALLGRVPIGLGYAVGAVPFHILLGTKERSSNVDRTSSEVTSNVAPGERGPYDRAEFARKSRATRRIARFHPGRTSTSVIEPGIERTPVYVLETKSMNNGARIWWLPDS